jgi:hypothetical protein
MRGFSKTLVAMSGIVAALLPMPAAGQTFITSWGTFGSGDGQFNQPTGVAVGGSGQIYVVDGAYSDNRVQVFTPDGIFLRKWSIGSGTAQNIAVDASDNVYVGDRVRQTIFRYTSTGTLITSWPGPNNDNFFSIGVDLAGNVYAADNINNRIVVYSNTGTILRTWGSFGSGDGQFNFPDGVCVDSDDNVYVADMNNRRVQKFTSTGGFLTKWGSGGSGDGQFEGLVRVAADIHGFVYTVDVQLARVQAFTREGVFVSKWGSFGSDPGQFSNPIGVAADIRGNVYVADVYNSRIQKFHNIAAPSDPTFTSLCFSSHLAPAMVTADFNHDGKLDVAMNPGDQALPSFDFTNLIDIFLGNGDGTFTFSGQLTTADAHVDMSLGDFDHDGNVDLVAGGNPNTPGSTLSVFHGNGSGTFGPLSTVPYPGGIATGVLGIDLDGDDYSDLVVADSKNKVVSVLMNKGDGTFKAKVSYRTAHMNVAVTSGDFNSDGLVDLVAYSSGNQFVSILLGKGTGKFTNSIDTEIPCCSPGPPGRDVVAADFNRDAKLDLVVSVGGSRGLYVLQGNGDGTFVTPVGYGMPGSTPHIDTGDFDGDGNLDIVAGNYWINYPNTNPGASVSILYGNGLGGLTLSSAIPVAYGFNVISGDMNADSRLDIVADGCVLLNGGSTATANIFGARQVKESRLAQAIRPAAEPVVGTRNGSAALGSETSRGPAATPSGSALAITNPVRGSGTLSFELRNAGPVTVRLFDPSGRLAQTLRRSPWDEPGQRQLRIDSQGLPPGIYLYRIDSADGPASGRVVIIN